MALHRRGKRGTYYIRCSIAGKPIWKSLHTATLFAAKQRHDQELVKLQAEHLGYIEPAAARTAPGKVATIGEILAAYVEAQPHKPPRPHVRKANANALRNMCRRAGIAKPDAASSALLDQSLVRRFQDAFVRASASNEVEVAQAKFSADSLLAQARSIFTHEQLLEAVALPHLESFRKAKRLGGAKEHTVEFVPMSQAEVDALETGAPALRKSCPQAYVAFRLMGFCGLRNEEVEALRPATWIREMPSGPAICVRVYPEFRPKGKGSVRNLGISRPLLEDLAPLWADSVHAIKAATDTERHDYIYRALNQWIQSMLPTRTAYDLRKQAGSNVLMQTRDLYRTSRFLGHVSIATTQRWYVGMLEELPVLTEIKGL